MKKQVLVVILLVAGVAQSQPQGLRLTDKTGRVKLLGQSSMQQLKEDPFGEWFDKNYNEYEVNKNHIAGLLDLYGAFDSVTLFMGTWCGDSKREVPRFYKILDQLKFDKQKVKLIAVDRTFQNYKQSPGREEAGLNIHRVPTFIFHKDSLETGRIVEKPRTTLEEDMQAIIAGKGYLPNYEVVQALDHLFTHHVLEDIQAAKDSLAVVYKNKVANKYELNTYGLLLFSSFHIAEAHLVYRINRLMFPDEPVTHASLARLEAVLGHKESALEGYEKALALAPDDKNIKSSIASLKGR